MMHATVKIGDYVLPLIGVPESATVSDCERCHRKFYLTDVELIDGEFICHECEKKKSPLVLAQATKLS